MLVVAVVIGFVVGVATVRRSRHGASDSGNVNPPEPKIQDRSSPASRPRVDVPSLPMVAMRSIRDAPSSPRYPLPPIPENDPGIRQFIDGPNEVPAAALESRWEPIDRRLDELFGESFPMEKRNAIRRAQEGWIKAHYHAVRAYYRGDISQEDLTTGIHKNMLAFAHSVEAALTASEYKRFMDLEPGVNPFIVLVPPGTMVGDTVE